MKANKKTIHPGLEQDILMEWESPSFIRYDKERRYLVFLIALWALFVLYALWVGAWTFVLLLMSILIVFTAEHRKNPKSIPVQLGTEGVRYGQHFFSYVSIKTFWILNENEAYRELHLQLKGGLSNHVLIYLGSNNIPLLRRILSVYVHESEGKQRFLIDHLIHILRLR